MNSEMTSVYSGGIMYEYSYEDNKYGIVSLSGGNVKELDEYAFFKSALKANPAPTGDGGAASTTHAVDCPQSASNWQVEPSKVPTMPQQAEKYMKDGAGDGPGMAANDDGSQNAGGSGTSTADATSGQASPTGGSGKKGDDSAGVPAYGALEKGPLAVTGLTLLFTLCGALLL